MTEARWARWAAWALMVVVAGVFGWLNSGERVSLDLGVFSLFRIPLALLIFVAFLLGMITMYLVGLRHDLELRRMLRERGLLEQPPLRPRADPPPDPPV